MARLQKYYGNVAKAYPVKAVSPEPKVQVQLITSCGASIANPCTVLNGPIFNVDTAHHAVRVNAKKKLVPIPTVDEAPFPVALTNVATHFDTAQAAGAGTLAVYPALKVPPPETV